MIKAVRQRTRVNNQLLVDSFRCRTHAPLPISSTFKHSTRTDQAKTSTNVQGQRGVALLDGGCGGFRRHGTGSSKVVADVEVNVDAEISFGGVHIRVGLLRCDKTAATVTRSSNRTRVRPQNHRTTEVQNTWAHATTQTRDHRSIPTHKIYGTDKFTAS